MPAPQRPCEPASSPCQAPPGYWGEDEPPAEAPPEEGRTPPRPEPAPPDDPKDGTE